MEQIICTHVHSGFFTLIEKGTFVLLNSVGKRDFASLCGQIRDYNRKLHDVPAPSFYFVETKIDG